MPWVATSTLLFISLTFLLVLLPVMLFNLHEKKQSLLEVQFRDVADQKTSGKKLTVTANWATGTQNLVEKQRLMESNLFTLKNNLGKNCTSWNYILKQFYYCNRTIWNVLLLQNINKLLSVVDGHFMWIGINKCLHEEAWCFKECSDFAIRVAYFILVHRNYLHKL